MISLASGGFSADVVRVALHASDPQFDFRYELLDSAGRRKKDLTTVTAGSVAHNALADIKRTARFALTEDPDINYLSDRIKPYVRLWIPPGHVLRPYVSVMPWAVMDENPSGWVEFPLGVFLLSTPPRRADSAGVITREIEAYDLGQILADDKVTTRHTVAAGQNYISGTNAVKDILTGAGLTAQNLTKTDKELPADVDWPPGTPKAQIINDLLRAINYTSLWFDENGAAVAAPYVSPSDRGSEYTYQDDDESVMFPDVEQSLDLFGVPNQWVLTVSEPDRTPLTYTYTNTNASSPTSTVSRGRTIVDYREVDAVDLDTLQAVGQRIAFEASQVYETVEFQTGIMPFHAHFDVYTLIFSTLNLSDKYFEESWEMDLKVGGRMKHRTRRVVTV